MACLYLAYELLIQRILCRNVPNPLPLPPIDGRTFVVTGATSGIGREVARQLAEAGGHVVMAVRNTKAATDLIKTWQSYWAGRGSPLSIETMELDLLSLESVARFAEAWNQRSVPLDCLINNAGIFSMGSPQKLSKDWYEEHLQVNHLSRALLSILLLPSLVKSSSSRIVNVNSTAHYFGVVDPEDMNLTSGKRKFTNWRGYSSSKLAEIMFSSVLSTRLSAVSGVHVVCVHPGSVNTNIDKNVPRIARVVGCLIYCFIFSPEEGSRSTLFAATDPGVADYCESLESKNSRACAYMNLDCRPRRPSMEANNVGTCLKVWEKTLELIGVASDAVEGIIGEGKVK